MRVRVRLTEPLWRPAGARELVVEHPIEGATVGAVLDQLAREHPKFGEELYSQSGTGDYYYCVFVNDRLVNLVERDEVLAKDGDEIFVMLPIAGGSVF